MLNSFVQLLQLLRVSNLIRTRLQEGKGEGRQEPCQPDTAQGSELLASVYSQSSEFGHACDTSPKAQPP